MKKLLPKTIRDRRETLQINHESTIKNLEESIIMSKKSYRSHLNEIQSRCPHKNVEYYPDPSGNNDSHYHCNDCGEDNKRHFG